MNNKCREQDALKWLRFYCGSFEEGCIKKAYNPIGAE
jgi:hypothetical protein